MPFKTVRNKLTKRAIKPRPSREVIKKTRARKVYTQEDIDKKTKLQYYSSIRRTMPKTSRGQKVWRDALSDKKGVRGGKLYKCYICGESFQRKDLELEHKIPVIDLRLTTDIMSWDYIYSRLNDENGSGKNLGIICKPCHKTLTGNQRKEKTRLKKTKKHLICQHNYTGFIKVITLIDLKQFDTSEWHVIDIEDTLDEALDNVERRRKFDKNIL